MSGSSSSNLPGSSSSNLPGSSSSDFPGSSSSNLPGSSSSNLPGSSSSEPTRKRVRYLRNFYNKIDYNTDTGYGTIGVGNMKVDMKMHFSDASKDQKNEYSKNSLRLMNSGYFVPMLGSTTAGYFTESYQYTLGDLIRESLTLKSGTMGEKRWWRGPMEGVRMGIYLQDIVRNVIKGINDLIEMEMYSDLNVNTVVFISGNISKEKFDVQKGDDFPIPKLINIWGDAEKSQETIKGKSAATDYDATLMWKKLAKLIRSIFEIANKIPHPEVREFCGLVHLRGKGLIALRISKHPALLLSEKIPDSAVEVYNLTRETTPYFVSDQEFMKKYKDWQEKIIMCHPYFAHTKKYWDKECAKNPNYTKYRNTTESFIHFIRNCVVHIGIYNKNKKDNNEKITMAKIEKEINERYPDFFSYIFEKQVMTKTGEFISPDKTTE